MSATVDTTRLIRERLTDAFREAAAAAREHEESEDGGTCNFDTAVLIVPRVRESLVLGAAAEAGVSVSVRQWMGNRCFFLLLGSGQANRNTRMAEAAAKALKVAGLDSCMYYQMD